MPMKLFATDLDGTLLDRDDNIHPRDAEVIREAMRRGVIVTIATGRLTTGTLPTARRLELTAPLVCGDGSVTACSVTARVLERRPLKTPDVERILGEIIRRPLASFVFTHDAIHSCARGKDHHSYVRAWSPEITTHADVLEAQAWRASDQGAVMVLGIGSRAEVTKIASWVEEEWPSLEAWTFPFGTSEAWVVRVFTRGVNKGAALESLSAQLGVARNDVAVIGDWLNDLPMFAWAPRSYAMPHAPEQVRLAATHPLSEGACKRGAIADALEDFMAS